MTYTPTNRPVPSDAPEDLYFNSSLLDQYANGSAPTVTDRNGVPRQSLAGITADANAAIAAANTAFQNFLNSLGRVDKGTYAAGIVLTTRSDVFYRNGFYYRAAPGTALPYTTTGTWASESSKFIVDFGPTNFMPEFYGAQADGTTDDSAAFAALEAAVKGKMVDLNGRTYIVSAVPVYNAYFNGFFKVGGFTKAAVLSQTFVNQPPHFHAFGGQLAKLKASLSNPLEQFTGLVFIGDSITWGSGNTGEQAPTDPRDGTLSDPRDYFGTSSYVNILKRYIGERYFFGATPVISNWADSPSGESTATYSRQITMFPDTGDFTYTASGSSVSKTRVTAAGSLTGYQLTLSDGNTAGTSSHSIKFNFTGTTFTLSFGVAGDNTIMMDYELFVNGVSQGVFTTSSGEDGLTVGNNRQRVHTFAYVRNKVIELKTKRRAGQTLTIAFRPEAIIVNKTCRIINQGINGSTSRTYRIYNLPGNSMGDGNAVNADDNFVFCQLGTNDRLSGTAVPKGYNEFAANLKAAIDIISPLADLILMCSNPAENESTSTYSFNMQDCRGVIYRAAKAGSFDMVDNYTALQNVNIRALANDGLHPNALGYAIMARNIINALEQA
ncbi:SGNH/GDSL hydrolase family protein [Pseudomonas putida]|uniref:SGNH/GDSL hydrolase family protein n=1 Tax=Pseudomonas putida TaxID=303 RepID=UPI0023640824|nr:SGNH/GDSL hydrolase family protein [Pseudomonas putida]MDD2018184.1 SGNH/GDSL hydrolase family protein [Pseudomonas putida]HDS1770624.1 SGNH/GDSL hydrolase family protein [Pseudomonas putida]